MKTRSSATLVAPTSTEMVRVTVAAAILSVLLVRPSSTAMGLEVSSP